MRRSIVLGIGIVLCAACAIGGTTTPKEIDGQEVLPGPVFTGGQLVELSQVRFYACKLKKNDADCTVITGYATCNTPHQNYVVTLDFDMWEVYASIAHKGTIRVELDRPKPGVPVKFTALGPAWHNERARGEDKRPVQARYEVTVSLRGYKPPKFKPATGDAP